MRKLILTYWLKTKHSVSISILLVLGTFLCLQNEAFIVGFFLILTCLFILFKFLYSDSNLGILLLVAFGVRLLFIILDESFQFYTFALDPALYDIISQQIIKNFEHNIPVYYGITESFSIRSYSLLIGFLYYIVGYYPIIPRIINAFVGVLAIVEIYKITSFLFSNSKISLRASAMVAFYPSLILFSCLNLRDALILYLSFKLVSLFMSVETSKNTLIKSIQCLILYIFIGLLRPQNFYLFGIIFTFYFLFLILKRYSLFHLIAIFLFGGFVLGYIFISNYDVIAGLLEYPLQALPRRALGGSAYLTHLQYENLLDVPIQAPIRLLYFTFGPFLWDVRNAFMLLAFFEAIIIFIVVYFSVKYLSQVVKINNNMLLLCLFSVIGLLANSTVDSNYGTAIRHRMVYVVPFFIFTSAYLQNLRIFLFNPLNTHSKYLREIS